jgi:predicted nucleotidyltransferase
MFETKKTLDSSIMLMNQGFFFLMVGNEIKEFALKLDTKEANVVTIINEIIRLPGCRCFRVAIKSNEQRQWRIKLTGS